MPEKFDRQALINLDAIRDNVRQFLKVAEPARVMAVVKADAYGHGALQVARAALEAGASWLGVAHITEALALRSAVQKDAEQQINDLNRAVELQSEKPDYLRLRAQHLAGKEKYDEALADIDRALEMDPDHAASHELRGMILLQLERYDDALASFDRASELEPDAALPYQHRGELYIKKGDTQSALEQLTKALEKQPQNLTALLVRAGIARLTLPVPRGRHTFRVRYAGTALYTAATASRTVRVR